MNGSLNSRLSLCLRAAALAAVASLAACGGNSYTSSNGPTPTPVTTSGAAVVYPQTSSVPVGGTINFLANLPGQTSTTFTWAAKGGGTISSTGVYTAGTTPATVTVTATSGSSVGTATVTITSAPADGITMNPAALFVAAGSTVQIAATSGGNAVIVTEWDVNGTQSGDTVHGTIDSSGRYTAPLTPPPGGSTTITAKTAAGTGSTVATVVFANASLNGPYAFSYNGEDSKGFLNVAGSFTANGGTGAISNMIEDIAASDVAPKTSTGLTGKFSVAPDGTASATLSDSSTWEFAIAGNTAANAGRPAQEALLVRFDKTGTGSGTMNQQDPATVELPMPEGPYTFGLSESGAISKVFAAAGKFQSSGLVGNTGSLTPGVWDVNEGGTVLGGGTTGDTTLGGSFATDAANPGTGRGTMQLTTQSATFTQQTFSFAFYVVDNTHLKVIETDGKTFSAGDIFEAPNTNGLFSSASLAKGNYAFTTTGASKTGLYSQGGVFISNGAGGITSGAIDVNAGAGAISLAGTISNASYTVDPTFGRIQFSITAAEDTKTIGTWDFAGYQTLSGAMEMVETDIVNFQTVVSGTAYRQTSTTGLQGGYAANFNGTNAGAGEGVAGQFVVSSTGISSGTLNSDILGSSVNPGVPITQAIVVAPDTTGRGTATIQTNIESFPIAYYIIDQNTALVFETDAVRNLTGTVARQF